MIVPGSCISADTPVGVSAFYGINTGNISIHQPVQECPTITPRDRAASHKKERKSPEALTASGDCCTNSEIRFNRAASRQGSRRIQDPLIG